MKILFDNAIKDATYSSVNASANYPARNLADDFLRLRYQVLNTNDSVTIQLSESISVDSFYIGYIGSIDDITVEFFSGDVVQQTLLGAEHEVSSGGDIREASTGGDTMHFGAGPADHWDDYDGEQFAVRHFALVTEVDRITITVTGSNPFYIGGVGAGVATEIPASSAGFSHGFDDNSVVSRSSHGQVQALYIEPYDTFQFDFEGITRADFVAVRDLCKSVGPRPVWVTPFEESTDEFPPGYYTVAMVGGQRGDRTYRFQLRFTEAR